MVWSTALLVGLVSVSVAGMSWAAQDTANAEAAPTAPAAAGSAEVAVPEGELTLEELLSSKPRRWRCCRPRWRHVA
jgi:hypothetical protein